MAWVKAKRHKETNEKGCQNGQHYSNLRFSKDHDSDNHVVRRKRGERRKEKESHSIKLGIRLKLSIKYLNKKIEWSLG